MKRSAAVFAKTPVGDQQSSSDAEEKHSPGCWITDVPDVILYDILTYVDRPGERAAFLSSTLSLVSRSVHSSIENKRHAVWESILREYSVGSEDQNKGSAGSTAATGQTRQAKEAAAAVIELRRQRRQSKRLRRTTAKQDVIAAHKVLCSRTEDAILHMAEWAHSSQETLSLARIRSVIHTYGPILRFNQRAKMGGTLLVECCRSRYVAESVIRRCAAELIERHGADPNVPAAEGHPGFEGAPLPALVIAAVRGMPTVVKLLLDTGANPNDRGTSRFRLNKKPKKSVKGDKLTPLEFVYEMKKAEEGWGATKDQVKDLDKVIKMLKKVTA
jgi:hypothetical protein